jgi:hypothetical protein
LWHPVCALDDDMPGARGLLLMWDEKVEAAFGIGPAPYTVSAGGFEAGH